MIKKVEIMLTLIVCGIIILILLSKSINIIKENQRIVIFRLGHFIKVDGPGVVKIIPFLERGVIIDLNKYFPDWKIMDKNDLNKKVIELILRDPNKKYT